MSSRIRPMPRLVAMAIAVLLATTPIASCGGGSGDTAPTLGVQADLAKLVLPQVPAGFTLVTDPGRSGSIGIGDVVSLEGATGQEGTTLAAFGFLDGYQKTFTGPTPDESLYVTVEQYTSAEGAADRFADATTRADGIEDRIGFDVPTIPEAHGSTFSGAAQGLTDTRLYQVLFPFEDLVVRVERTTTADSGVTSADAVAIAEQQYQVLREQ